MPADAPAPVDALPDPIAVEATDPASTTPAPQEDAEAVAARREKRAARNRKWRELHKDAIRERRGLKRAALLTDPVALAKVRERQREQRRKRLADEAVRARVRDVRKAWRERRKAAVAAMKLASAAVEEDKPGTGAADPALPLAPPSAMFRS
jgi:hypothetical protein